jgi:hypothetical protein
VVLPVVLMNFNATNKNTHNIDHNPQKQVKILAYFADGLPGLREYGAKPNIIVMK